MIMLTDLLFIYAVIVMAICNHVIPLQPPPLEVKRDTSQIDGPSPKNVFGFEFSPSDSGKDKRMHASQVRKCERKVLRRCVYKMLP